MVKVEVFLDIQKPLAPLVSDVELKSILKQDAILTGQHIQELRGFMEKSDIATC